MDADNYFKVFKAWGLLLILSLLKFSNFFISVDSQYAFVINSSYQWRIPANGCCHELYAVAKIMVSVFPSANYPIVI